MTQEFSLKLSVVLATFNEEGNIGRCLDSVRGIADEIVVVDGESGDKTTQIAKDKGARMISTSNKTNFHINKQMAMEEARGEWVLQLDADEVVSPLLAEEITRVIRLNSEELSGRTLPEDKRILFERHQKLLEARDGEFERSESEIVAFFIPRVNMFMGRELRHGGVYPDGVIRLIKNGKARFPAKSVHEQIEVDGKVGWLVNDLLHFDSPTFTKYIVRANRYTSLTASRLADEGVGLSWFNDVRYLLVKPVGTFMNLYYRHRGFKDGFPGFVWALFSGLHHSLAYMKLLRDVKKD